MEHTNRGKRVRPNLKIIFCFMTILFIFPVNGILAQTQKHYEERYKQFRSMETGVKWDFQPGLYYAIAHRRYSGASGFFKPKFNILKSNVGCLSPKRVAEVELENEVSKKLDKQISAMDSVLAEETLRTIERSVDETYDSYKPAFDSLKSNISAYLNCNEVLVCEEMLKRSQPLREELEMLDEEIKYIHKAGLDNQLEQGKRDIAYNEIKDKLNKLCGKSHSLAMLAKAYKDIFH